ncbi:MAG TPA: sensor histidine kinase [Ruania sp.]|nr:sensor histidine kinase [Ruania sp.]
MNPRVTDLLLGAGIALGVALVIAADWQQQVAQSPWAYLFALGFGAAMVWRRQAPRVVLALTVLGIFAYYALDYPPIGIALPAVAALYSCAEQRHTLAAAVGGSVLTAVSAFFRVREGLPTTYLASYEVITNVALIAAAIALGVSVRLRREARQQAEQIADLTAEAAVQQVRTRAQVERVQLARDLHDVIGHTLSVVSVHAHVAEEAIGVDDGAARRALQQVRQVIGPAMRDLRGTVRLLRSDTDLDAPATADPPGLAGLPALVAALREAGIAVELQQRVPQDGLSVPIEAAAYRIVQEALTNVLRHAHATTVTVHLELAGDRLRIEVGDDGRGGDQPAGHGITGMVERARLLGGTVTAGARTGRGYQVLADLPARLGP